jgi:Tol biopolymer transport system component
MLDALADDGRPEQDVLSMSLGSGQVTKLVEHPADDFLLGWSPDGSYILFGSNRRGPVGAWVQPVANGKADGAPVQVLKDIGTAVTPIGVVDSGDLYFSVQTGQRDNLFWAALDDGGLLSGPVHETAEVAVASAPEFSPDGNEIAYLRQRGKSGMLFASELVVRSVDSGEERVLPPLALRRQNAAISGVVTKPRWSPDGRYFLLQGIPGYGNRGPHLVRIDNGGMKRMHPDQPLDTTWVLDWSVDSRLIYEIKQDQRSVAGLGAWHIQSRDVASGTVQSLVDYQFVPHIAQDLATSPDGRWIAYTASLVPPFGSDWTSSLLVIPVNGGRPRELYRVSRPEFLGALDWSPDSSRLLFGTGRFDAGKEHFILKDIALEGGGVRNLGLSMDGVYLQGLSVHPNGRRIAFTVGVRGSREVRVLRGLSVIAKR